MNIETTSLAALSDLARLQIDLEAQMAKNAEEAAKLKAQYTNVTEIVIPMVMNAVGMSQFVTEDGFSIEVGEKIHANISEDRNKKAIEWLDEHDCDKLVKRNLLIAFEKEDLDKLQALEADLQEQGFQTERTQTVHPRTLAAWVKERLTKGDELDMALFGVHIKPFSKATI